MGGGTPGLDNASLAILDGPSWGVSPNGDSLPSLLRSREKGSVGIGRERGRKRRRRPVGRRSYGKEGRVCGGGKGEGKPGCCLHSVYSIQRRKEGEGARGPRSLLRREREERGIIGARARKERRGVDS